MDVKLILIVSSLSHLADYDRSRKRNDHFTTCAELHILMLGVGKQKKNMQKV